MAKEDQLYYYTIKCMHKISIKKEKWNEAKDSSFSLIQVLMYVYTEREKMEKHW